MEYFVQDFTNSIQMACVGPAGVDHKFGNEQGRWKSWLSHRSLLAVRHHPAELASVEQNVAWKRWRSSTVRGARAVELETVPSEDHFSLVEFHQVLLFQRNGQWNKHE